VNDMEWTDGVGKALGKLASVLNKEEKGRHADTEDYYADPHVYVMDMNTGAAVLLEVDTENAKGKTHGRGYRRCAQVQQRMPSKFPQKKVMSRLLSMAIRNFVPEDTDPAYYSVVVNKAIEDIAQMLTDDSEWNVDDEKHSPALNKAISKLMDMTLSNRAGDTLINIKVTPVETAMMDTSAIVENKQEVVIE
jgi:hypothetical protein